MSSFISRITTPEFAQRAEALKAERPDIETTSYMLGADGYLGWAHTVGVATDEQLRALAPPLPPFELRSIVAASSEPVFLWTGLFDAATILALYEKHAAARAQTVRILDFGCGCGRMTRFYGQDPTLQVSGSDVNGNHIDWCRESLAGVASLRNEVLPPLPFEEASFDLIYSFSIFTHLPATAGLAWTREIARVLAPGGIACLTTHGYPALDTIAGSPTHQAMFNLTREQTLAIRAGLPETGYHYLRYADEVIASADAGADYGNSFTHESYIRREWPKLGLKVLDFLPGGMRGWQDVTVVTR